MYAGIRTKPKNGSSSLPFCSSVIVLKISIGAVHYDDKLTFDPLDVKCHQGHEEGIKAAERSPEVQPAVDLGE